MPESSSFGTAPMRAVISYLQSRNGVLMIVLTISSFYLWNVADRDWIPFDDGSLGHAAERVLQGEWPHRDFDDIYTGGQAGYHALLFRLFGIDLLSLRMGLFIFCPPFMAAIYAISTRFCRPWVAGAITLLCMVWSVPNYFASMPSWYNLFFATFSVLAILKHIETSQARWLFLAGLCGGVSMLFKMVGLFAIGAGVLFLAYREQSIAAQSAQRSNNKSYSVFVWAGLAIFIGNLVWLVAKRVSTASIIHFLLPGVVLCTIIAVNEWKFFRRPRVGRLKKMLGMTIPYIGGALLPVVLFVIPYVTTSSLEALGYGVFIRPQMRVQRTYVALPPVTAQMLILPLGLLLLGRRFWRSPKTEWIILAPVCFVLSLLVWFGGRQELYVGVWNSVRAIVPVTTLIACPLLLGGQGSVQKQTLFLLVSMADMVSLIQFPASLGIYFCYMAPLAILAVASLGLSRASVPRILLFAAMSFYFLFAVVWMNRSDTFTLSLRHDTFEDAQLGIERGHLRVAPHWAKIYQALVAEVEKHSPKDAFIYATVDSSDVYFLCNRKNPTRTFYEIFDDDYLTDPAGYARRIKELLERKRVKVVVLRWGGERYSGNIPPELLEWIIQRFPHVSRMPYDYFTVLWRD